MVRAAAAGVVDFAKADPLDKYWWRRMWWLLDSITQDDDYRLLEARHLHWAALAANARLTDDSFNAAKALAQRQLDRLVGARFPEQLEAMRREQFANTTEGAIAAWRSQYGYPGEPRYEAVKAKLARVFKTTREARERRRAQQSKEAS